jgi:mannose/fructose/N-acetylgalactosamine-specific phosphotransferase system component IIC
VKAAIPKRFLTALLGLAFVAMPQVASACAACFGKDDGPMARGMNMGIFTLLIVVGLVLTGIAAVGIFFAVRCSRLEKAAAAAASAPPLER